MVVAGGGDDDGCDSGEGCLDKEKVVRTGVRAWIGKGKGKDGRQGA